MFIGEPITALITLVALKKYIATHLLHHGAGALGAKATTAKAATAKTTFGSTSAASLHNYGFLNLPSLANWSNNSPAQIAEIVRSHLEEQTKEYIRDNTDMLVNQLVSHGLPQAKAAQTIAVLIQQLPLRIV